ncbi:MAG TPA: alpha-amylase family glycosyl hydrolase [Candidatus Saccharimonadales bacterium]|nr:alpha-amylase family glycosyl hydrolase [Candidatus Saccharimonadales bacterium]
MARWQDVNGIYQIYPRSFKDSNGDGVGDLAGMTEKLDYIKGKRTSLGIDAVWISPFYRSPMADFGYDISDYYSVDPLFGDLEDFKTFLAEAHRRNIKVMVDYVPNHTSDEHPWFKASKSSRDNEKRDWYVWRNPGSDGGPPNNWLSAFGDSAWQFNEDSGQYYLHSFLAKQPDLNWDNPEVRAAMMAVLDFWLSLGVDGIRADAVRWISKDPDFRDNQLNPDFLPGDDPYSSQRQLHSRYGPKLFDYLKEMADVVERYDDRIILFEDYQDKSLDRHAQYAAFYAVNPSVAAPFNFEGLDTPYSATAFRSFIDSFQKIAGNELRPFYCFGNHDQPRLASRIGIRQARLVALLQLTLPGIPVIYYGEELGMQSAKIAPADVQDPYERQTPGLGLGRDPERTPMQWTNEAHGGFSTADPWLQVNDDLATVNVATQAKDDSSSLSMYRVLLELRRSSALRSGVYIEWPGSNDDVFGYSRQSEYETLLILLNMSGKTVTCRDDVRGEVIYSTDISVESVIDEGIALSPHQGVIIRRQD